MLETNALKEYENSYRLGRSFRKSVASYIERCRLEDGGYCFFRILPSSGADTFYAVKSLSLLGMKPEQPERIVDFFFEMRRSHSLDDLTGTWLATEVFSELGQLTDDFRNHAEHVLAFENRAGRLDTVENVYIEVPSELEPNCRAARVLKIIGSTVDKTRFGRQVSKFLNADGGYGGSQYSTLASTFYATEIVRLLDISAGKPGETRNFLRAKEESLRENLEKGLVQYIEDVFYLIKSLSNLS